MRPKKMQSSDRNTMMTTAERLMNRPYFWAIQDVNANSTGKKNVLASCHLYIYSKKWKLNPKSLDYDDYYQYVLPIGNANTLGSVLVL